MAEQPSTLRSELNELLLVGLGAVPGALLRWQVALRLEDQNLLVNSLGDLISDIVWSEWEKNYFFGALPYTACARIERCE